MTWCQALCKAYMSRRGLEDRKMTKNNKNRIGRRSTIFGKINGTFLSTLERMKLHTTSTRIPSPAEIIDTNEYIESGRSADFSP